jgi:hypothetical protein
MENNNFVEVMEHFDRMCSEYSSNCDANKCPLAKLMDEWEKENNETWDESCVYFARECPFQFADAVMKWAKDNPIPIYPKIGEVVAKMFNLMNLPKDALFFNLETRLNKETAELFNIEPINKIS